MSSAVQFITHAKLPTQYGEFTVHVFTHNGVEHLVLSCGALHGAEGVMCRMHSECLTGDGLFSLRCDCGPQLQSAMQRIAEAGRGLIVYLRQEGRGIGLVEKIKAYHLQDEGEDTVSANLRLGHPADARDYGMMADVLAHFAVRSIRLMTNNPRKIKALEAQGVQIDERLPLRVGEGPHNRFYLHTKRNKLDHL